jgi:hypothetical protein
MITIDGERIMMKVVHLGNKQQEEMFCYEYDGTEKY